MSPWHHFNKSHKVSNLNSYFIPLEKIANTIPARKAEAKPKKKKHYGFDA